MPNQQNNPQDFRGLKGHKLFAKTFRRNMMVKSRNKNIPQCISPSFSASRFDNTQNLNYSFQVKRSQSQTNCHSVDHTVLSKMRQSQNMSKLTTNNDGKSIGDSYFQQQKRMEEYLDVVFKKVQVQAHKLMRTFEEKFDIFRQVKTNVPNFHNNFIRRFKRNASKCESKKMCNHSRISTEPTTKMQIHETQQFINKIKKSQTVYKPHKQNRLIFNTEPQKMLRPISASFYLTNSSKNLIESKKTKVVV